MQKVARRSWLGLLAVVIVTVTMLLGLPQNAKAAANPPKVIETRVGPFQCVAIPGVTKVRVRPLAPSNKEIDYKVYWNGNERATYEYCQVEGGGKSYTLKPGQTQTHTPNYPSGRRVEITNENYATGEYGSVLVVEDLTPFEDASSGKAKVSEVKALSTNGQEIDMPCNGRAYSTELQASNSMGAVWTNTCGKRVEVVIDRADGEWNYGSGYPYNIMVGPEGNRSGPVESNFLNPTCNGAELSYLIDDEPVPGGCYSIDRSLFLDPGETIKLINNDAPGNAYNDNSGSITIYNIRNF